uniref:Uncharacterized protein n=1 Tax=Anopheles atroparvus TaxID=41427 RepID=A0AAG5DDJ8_ANOAO
MGKTFNFELIIETILHMWQSVRIASWVDMVLHKSIASEKGVRGATVQCRTSRRPTEGMIVAANVLCFNFPIP